MREIALKFTRKRESITFGLLITLFLTLLGCQSAAELGAEPAVEAAVLVDVAVVEAPTSIPAPTLPAPSVSISGAADPAAAPPSFAPLSAADVAATAEARLPTATLFPTATRWATATPFATITTTPQATFTPPPPPLSAGQDHYWLRRPVPEGSAVWTDKAYPFGSTRNGSLRPHHGVEFNVTYDTPVLAAANGEVVYAAADDGQTIGPELNFYGNVIVVKIDGLVMGQEIFILYGHLNAIQVTAGQRVNAGDVLGLSGATGVADGPHLHFEVRVGANTYAESRNPLLWLYPFSGRGTVAGRVTWPDGSAVLEAPVSLRRVDGTSRYAATTTYADSALRSDPTWGENFALDDVDAGFYELTVGSGEGKQTVDLWVYAGQTTFVEVMLAAP
jgi:murein DD-endopeptidase MepM/ murein hydrolase activator NlpD